MVERVEVREPNQSARLTTNGRDTTSMGQTPHQAPQPQGYLHWKDKSSLGYKNQRDLTS